MRRKGTVTKAGALICLWTLGLSLSAMAAGTDQIRFFSDYQETIYPELCDNSALALRAVLPRQDSVGRYGLFEVDVDIAGSYDNPFDPEQIEVLGRFTAPSGTVTAVPAFFYRCFQGETSPFGAVGRFADRYFRLRFAPKEVGQYSYTIHVANEGTTVVSETRGFLVTDSQAKGFVHVDPISRSYLVYDDGSSYFAVGESLAWPPPRMHMDFMTFYETLFKKLSENGCNYSRIWTCDWNIPIEWTAQGAGMGTCYNLGKYSLDNSWRLDKVIGLAEEYEIHLMITLDTYGSLLTSSESAPWGEDRWDSENPYNARLGGPCATPDEFFTNASARKLYQRRLRYILSRWGYSPNLLTIELWSEVDTPRQWCEEMASYIKENDPYGHLVSSSLGYPWDQAYDEDNLWTIPDIDYMQLHVYDNQEPAVLVPSMVRPRLAKYDKPILFAEYGLSSMSELPEELRQGVGEQGDLVFDPTGEAVHLHNAIWASIASGCMGIPMTHWVEYVDKSRPEGLYSLFQNAASFVSTVPWAGYEWRDAAVSNPHPKARVFGRQNLDEGFVWVQNKDYTWANIYGKPGAVVNPISFSFAIGNLLNATYTIEHWDTHSGSVVSASSYVCTNRKITVDVEDLEKDLLIRFCRSPADANTPGDPGTETGRGR